jgi:hypothetical protein
MRVLVTRWRKVGAFGRTGPRACEVTAARVLDSLAVRIESHGQEMTIFADRENAEKIARQIIKECRKLPR